MRDPYQGCINRELEKLGKALINMGTYDGQTIAGVISTSTHGSGITLEKFPDYLRSIFLLTEDGILSRLNVHTTMEFRKVLHKYRRQG